MSNGKETEKENTKSNIGYFFDFKEVLNYYFRKKEPGKKIDFNLKMMHGINKISIIMFMVALVIIITRFVVRAM